MFRSRNHFRVPSVRIGPLVAIVLAIVVIGGLGTLAVIEPAPPVKHFEVPVNKG